MTGALPAYAASGTLLTSATMPGTNVLNSPAHAVGDLLFVSVLTRNANNDGLLTDVNAAGGTSGWTLNNNGGSAYGGAQAARLGFGWKIATATNEVCSITTTGGTTTDRILARVHKFTAANGFATTAIANVGTPTTGTLSASQDMTMPTVAAGGANELALCIYGIGGTSTVAAAGAVTGGTWAEPLAEDTGTNGCMGFQTADDSDASGMSGGTSATSNTADVWVAVPMRIVPIAVVPTGQPTSKRFGAIPYAGQRKKSVRVW